MADPLAAWPAFVAAARARLEQGRSAYCDRSFERDPSELLAEISAELLDTCTWSFILWARLQRIAAEVVGKLEVPGDG